MRKNIIVMVLCCLVFTCVSTEARTYKVTASAYNTVKKQTSKHPHITAFGKKPKKWVTLAVSWDLKHLRNKKVKLVDSKTKQVIGVFEVGDKMNKRYKRSVDICLGKDISAAKEFGRQHDIKLIPL